jgi:hypothetical protein
MTTATWNHGLTFAAIGVIVAAAPSLAASGSVFAARMEARVNCR